MICSNDKCGKEIDKPLELFDGSLACPYCKQPISLVKEFEISLESDEMFRLSELYFFRSLERSTKPAEAQAYIDQALRYCILAARSGHPKAIWRMGFYYDKDYIDTNRSETERCRIAYDYYTSICYSTKTQIQVESGVKGYEGNALADLKKRAALDLLNMLIAIPPELDAQKRYNYERNRQEVSRLYGVGNSEVRKALNMKASGSQKALNLFRSCFAEDRVPLFGYFRITNADLLDAVNYEQANDKFTFIRMTEMNLNVWYMPCDEYGRVDETGNDYFQALRGAQLIKDTAGELADGKPEGSGYLFFFNKAGKHTLGGGARNKALKQLSANDFAIVKQLINKCCPAEYTFKDDDLVFHKTVENLIDRVEVGA